MYHVQITTMLLYKYLKSYAWLKNILATACPNWVCRQPNETEKTSYIYIKYTASSDTIF